jgi:hypothetical protein
MLYSTIVQVNDEYMKTLETLSKKIKFIDADPMVKSSKALKDVQPEVERLRQKAVSKVWKTIVISCWLASYLSSFHGFVSMFLSV